MRQHGIASQLVMGPWNHMHIPVLDNGHIGERNFGLGSIVPPGPDSLTDLQLDFFDTHLRDHSESPASQTPVRIFVMGANQWRDEQEWPLARALPTALYLQADKQLSFATPTVAAAQTEFTYDPRDPVLTCGGGLVMSNDFPPGPKDQKSVEDREDVLVFTTDVLTEDLEITGRVSAVVHVATDAPTTDWVVRLCDVDEHGTSFNIVDGITRIETTPGRIDEIHVDLWSTSIVIKAGHRLRAHVTSSNFPRWDRNTNTGDPTVMRPARQTIHHDSEHPSHLLLPVIPSQSP